MPMLDVQRRHMTVFRIRFGEQRAITSGPNAGKTRPAKLTDAIRVTSPNPAVVDAFIDVYGGDRRPWDGDKWEAKLPTTALQILVLPGQSISQWWEKYRGGICERRCDGHTEWKSKKPCMCGPDVEARVGDPNQCSPTTRVSVLCPDVAVIGSGMFVCHGLIGAETLPQSIAVAEAALARGMMVPAVLRIVEYKGENQTFVVPQIEVVGMSYHALEAAAAGGQLVSATAPSLEPSGESVRRFGAVPARQLDAPSLADQYAEFGDAADTKTAQRAQRANAAAPIPPTGVHVRPRSEAPSPSVEVPPAPTGGDAAAAKGKPPEAAATKTPAGSATPKEDRPPPPEPPDPAGRPAADDPAERAHRRLMAELSELGLNATEMRHTLCRWASLGRTSSSRQMTSSEREAIITAARRIATGEVELVEVEKRDPLRGEMVPHLVLRPTADDADGEITPGSNVLTPSDVAGMKGRDLVDALRSRDLPVGGTVPEMRRRLVDALNEEPF